MFTTREKMFIAGKIQELLSDMDHPDLPNQGNIHFHLHINGTEPWSFCDINNARSKPVKPSKPKLVPMGPTNWGNVL